MRRSITRSGVVRILRTLVLQCCADATPLTRATRLRTQMPGVVRTLEPEPERTELNLSGPGSGSGLVVSGFLICSASLSSLVSSSSFLLSQVN